MEYIEKEQQKQQDYDEIDLMDYVKVVIKRKWLILILGLGAAVVAGLLSFFVLPEIYKIDTAIEIGKIGEELIEAPADLEEKINSDVYGILVREKLGISELAYPKIKTENPKNTRLILFTIESADAQQAKNILGEINSLISIEHQEKINAKKELLENDIKRIKNKIDSGEEENKSLEAQIGILEKIPPEERSLDSQFILLSIKEKLEKNKQEIENLYLQINSLQRALDDIRPTSVVKEPAVSENPVKPKPLLNIAIAGILGIFIGVFLAFGKEWWEKSTTP